jgi:hypothetical protein
MQEGLDLSRSETVTRICSVRTLPLEPSEMAHRTRAVKERQDDMGLVNHPQQDDVVIRAKVIRANRGNPSTAYLVGTPSAPGQFLVGMHDEAVSIALRFAKQAHAAAWFTDGSDDFVLLGTFRKAVKLARSA